MPKCRARVAFRYNRRSMRRCIAFLFFGLTLFAQSGPRLYFHARFWHTPGFQPRDGDYGYLQMTPGPGALDQIRTILKDVPPQHRLVLATAIDGMDDILRELIERENFEIACLGYDVEGWELTPDAEKSDPVAACKRGQALAHKYGL